MSFKLSIGKVAIAGVPLYTNEAIAAFSPNTTKLENSFLRYALPYFVGHVETDQAVKGATLNKAKLKSLVLLLPPLHEQRRIAEILSSVDDAIAATRAVIEQTRKVKQGVLERLLTKGIGHTRFKQTEIGEIPEGWRFVQVANVAASIDSGWSPDCEKVAAAEGEWGRWGKVHMAQFSMEIMRLTGSVLRGNQQRRQRLVDRAHFVGVAGIEGLVRSAPVETTPAALLRPLAEYEAVVGGGW